jgi:phage shock protein E
MDFQGVLKEITDGTAILIDVREPFEWEEDHLIHSRLFPINKLADHLEDLPRDKKIYTHCQRGYRAKNAAEYLQRENFQAEPLKCSFEELKQAGL